MPGLAETKKSESVEDLQRWGDYRDGVRGVAWVAYATPVMWLTTQVPPCVINKPPHVERCTIRLEDSFIKRPC